MHLSKNNQLRAFSLIELMIVIGVMFILSTLALAMLHVTSELSVQAHCAGNMRSLYQLVKLYRLENSTQYPPQYPQISFPTLFQDAKVPDRTFKCFAFNETTGDPNDVYSPFYIQPRDDEGMPELLFLSCPYHDENRKTVYVTNRGRVNTADNEVLKFNGNEVDPLDTLTNGSLLLGDTGSVNLKNNLQAQLLSVYHKEHKYYLYLKVVQDSCGQMAVILPQGAQVVVISQSGIVVLEADTETGKFLLDHQYIDPEMIVTVTVNAGVATLFGDNIKFAQ